MRCFRRMIQDRRSEGESTTGGLLFVVNHMLKVAFKINNFRFAQNAITSVQASNFPSIDQFPMSQRVTFLFYHGKFLIYKERYAEAESCLDEAMHMCYDGVSKDEEVSYRNRRRILMSLVPLKLLLGKMPKKKEVLVEYKLHVFEDVCKCLKQGLVKEYDLLLEKYFMSFLKHGIVAMMENLRKFVFRSLLKKVYIVNDQLPDVKKAQFIRLSVISAAMRVSGCSSDGDDDESCNSAIECALANAINDGLVKGYVAQGLGLMVSKKDAFPGMSI
eukprot:TRINITY_DN3598_c0_g1_i1.p1 TRINITY_DN3598_c0_g1~~TRINITY_DN3598_c0_g1_i1.p1  ORF type:complete len:274 (-),score=90.44 TRINITY_DN3598_c0_g1_i1:42-863(-)